MPQAATKARPAQFDAANQERRVLIAKIHVAKKEMRLLEDDYRQMLIEVTGRASSADCTVPELRAMVEAMKAKGFQPKKAVSPSAADHPFAAKARALWISLYHLGAIDNPSEQALEAFARRQLGCEDAVGEPGAGLQADRGAEGDRAAQRLGPAHRLDLRHEGRCAPTSRCGSSRSAWSSASRTCSASGASSRSTCRSAGSPGARRHGARRAGPLWDLGDLDLLAKALGEKLREAGGDATARLSPDRGEPLPRLRRSQWHVGRVTAECAFCATAIPLAITPIGGEIMSIGVSDHALLRFLERAGGLDIEELRATAGNSLAAPMRPRGASATAII
jgi:hypothetical protein